MKEGKAGKMQPSFFKNISLSRHKTFGDVKRLITVEFVSQMYVLIPITAHSLVSLSQVPGEGEGGGRGQAQLHHQLGPTLKGGGRQRSHVESCGRDI